MDCKVQLRFEKVMQQHVLLVPYLMSELTVFFWLLLSIHYDNQRRQVRKATKKDLHYNIHKICLLQSH